MATFEAKLPVDADREQELATATTKLRLIDGLLNDYRGHLPSQARRDFERQKAVLEGETYELMLKIEPAVIDYGQSALQQLEVIEASNGRFSDSDREILKRHFLDRIIRTFDFFDLYDVATEESDHFVEKTAAGAYAVWATQQPELIVENSQLQEAA